MERCRFIGAVFCNNLGLPKTDSSKSPHKKNMDHGQDPTTRQNGSKGGNQCDAC